MMFYLKKEKIMSKRKSTFWADFKQFITRGNVLDMAVGVVIGGAFGKIVTGLVNYVINPFVGLFVKSGSLDGIKTVIHPAVEAVKNEAGEIITPATAEVAILWGTWLQTIIDFLITALCIFVVLRVLVKAKNRLDAKKIAEAEAKAKAEAEKAEADKKAAEEAAAALAAKQADLERSILAQEKLLSEMCEIMKKK